MRDWLARTFSERNEDPDPRANPELTETARKRISHTLKQYVDRKHIDDAYAEFLSKKGDGPAHFSVGRHSNAIQSNHRFIIEEDHLDVIEYLELLINAVWSDETLDHTELLYMNAKINDALRREAVLWKLVPPEQKIAEILDRRSGGPSYGSPVYVPKKDGQFQFEQLADETVEQADQAVRVLMQGSEWNEPLKPYNEAWEAFQEGPPYSAIIAEKLYNALENVLQKICVDQGWENDQQTVGTYFQRISNEGLLDTNPQMIGEWQKILKGMQIGVQKTGGDRKNWHKNMEEGYILLLIHQTSAFLTFLIRRYEDQYST